MKTIITLLIGLLITSALIAQQPIIDFENVGPGFSWTEFANKEGDMGGTFDIVVNPSKTGLNTTDSVAKMTARAGSDPWAGLTTKDYDTSLAIDETNKFVTVLVYRPNISNFGMKLEDGGTPVELKVANTKTDEWEQLIFNFSDAVGETYKGIVFFPDFVNEAADRTEDVTVYWDNVAFVDSATAFPATTTINEYNELNINVYPNPASEVLFIYGTYITDIEILDMLGKKVMSVNSINNKQYNIHLEGLKPGMYMVVVHSNTNKGIRRFIVK